MGGDRGWLDATPGGAEGGEYWAEEGGECGTLYVFAVGGRVPLASPNSLYDAPPFVTGGGAVGGAVYVCAVARPPPTLC